MGSPVRFTSSTNPRHFALNSLTETDFKGSGYWTILKSRGQSFAIAAGEWLRTESLWDLAKALEGIEAYFFGVIAS